MNNAYEENGSWYVEFNEQGEIDKNARVNPQDPHDIQITAYEGDEVSVSLGLQL